jgi:hypothetical protein
MTQEAAMKGQGRRAAATKATDAKIGFYIHLAVFVVVNAGLAAINLSTPSDILWFQWPLLGWGLGLVLHALLVFVFPPGSRIRERLIAREMARRTR